MSDLIDKRDERTRKRKKIKRKMDSIIGLSYHDKEKKVLSVSADVQKLSDNKARLLDEGYIDNGFVIKKGTLEKYLSGKNQYVRGWEFDGEEWKQTEVLNLTPDFEGTVNLGHMDFSIMPFILGSWTKEDLTLVDIENDRQALDVNLHLDEESMFVKELKRQPFDIGISAEFWVHENEEDTKALSEMLGYYLPVFDEIFIFAYGLVGECGNVNSSGLELKGEAMSEELKEVMTEEVETEEVETEEVEEEVIEETEEVSEDTEEVELSVEEEIEESSEEGESEEDSEEEVDEAEADETELDEVLDEIEQLRTENAELKAQVESLTEANTELKKSNKRLNKKLSTEKEKKEAFIKNAKGISVKLGINEETKEEKSYTDMDYIRRG